MRRALLLDVYTLNNKAGQIVDRAVDGVGISAEDFAFCSMIGDRESVTPTELAREFGQSLSTILFRANRNVELGWVERIDNPRDGRSFQLRMTPKGRKAWERAATNLWRLVQQIEKRLGRPIEEVEQALLDLGAAMDAILAK